VLDLVVILASALLDPALDNAAAALAAAPLHEVADDGRQPLGSASMSWTYLLSEQPRGRRGDSRLPARARRWCAVVALDEAGLLRLVPVHQLHQAPGDELLEVPLAHLLHHAPAAWPHEVLGHPELHEAVRVHLRALPASSPQGTESTT
jgi:hypothetical protein